MGRRRKRSLLRDAKLEQGDLEAVERLMRINIPHLAELAREGYAILAGVPSCTLMFKQELPLMFPEDETFKPSRQRSGIRSTTSWRG